MLRDEAMIVRLSISQWTARKFDRGVTQKVANDYGTSANVGRYNKILIAQDAIKAVTQAVSNARTFHYENTLPWDDTGGRILPSANFLAYSKKMREFRAEFDDAVQTFVSNYAEYREEARRKLGGMFKMEDYPGHYEVRHKYGYSVDIEPIPSAADFRITVSQKDSTRIKKELEARVKDRETEAMKDLYLRLNKTIGHFHEKLSDVDAIFRDSLVENVIELVNLLPRLNIAGDPELDKLLKETQKKLCAFEPDQLRDDAKARSKAAGDAKSILDKMAGYVGK